MKIAFLSPFFPYRGGIAQFSDSLYLSLSKLAEVKAFSFKRQYPKLLFPGTSQYTVETDKKQDFQVDRSLDSINPLSYGKTANHIIEYKPDLLLQPYWMPFFAPSLGWIAKKVHYAGSKVISIMHNVVPHEPRFGDIALTKFYLRHNDAFILLSESNKKELEELVPNVKYIIHSLPFHDHYTPRIPKEEARKKLGIPNDKKILIYFGFIRDYKGLDLLIESMKYLDDSYRLMIVGEVYGEFSKYQEQIDRLGLGERIIKFIKYIPDTDIPTYFSAADVCVLTYKSATQSGIVGISYQFDVPVIVTDVGGFKELVEENKTALVVKNLDPVEISSAVKKYFTEGLEEKFVPNIAAVRAKHSWGGLAKDVIELYQKIR